MAMNRTHMRRQLYRGGGIADLYPRQKFGLGSKIKERIRKLIPNELADVAAKAAPFVAPFNPLAAGIMRGVGRFDKRGSISDALKQGLLTYGGGQAARYLGGAGMQTGFNPMGGMGAGQGAWSTPIGTDTGFKMGAWSGADKAATVAGKPNMLDVAGPVKGDQGPMSKFFLGEKGGTGLFKEKGLIGAGGELGLQKSFGKGLPAVFAGSTIATYAAQKALGAVGEREAGESLEAYNKRRKGTVGQYLDFYYRRANKFRIAPEEMDAAAAKFVEQNTKEYVSQGGRIGYQTGGISMGNTLEQNIAANKAQQQANQGVFAAARSRLPGYTAPVGTITSPRTVSPEVVSPRTVTPEESPLTVMPSPQYKDPLPQDELMAGFEDYIRDNPDAMSGAGMAAMIPATLPGDYEHEFTGGVQANAFNKYLESIGQAPYTRRDNIISPMGPMDQSRMDMTGPEFTGFDYSQPTDWSPGQAAPEGYRVVDMAGDQFLERIYPSKEEMDRMGGLPVGPMMPGGGPMPIGIPRPPSDPWEGLSEQERDERMLSGQEYAEKYNIPYNKGGRVGLYGGGEAGIKSLEAGASDITYEGNEGPKSPAVKEMEMAGMMDQISSDFEAQHGYDISLANPDMREEFILKWKQENFYDDYSRGPVIPSPEDPINPFTPKPTGPVLPDKQMAAQGGRIGQIYGTGPNGLPGIPQMAPDGLEYDMRENGGFQGLGAKEGKDDVNAKLAKNEFVFTADAVRGAGGGDIELGAQKMYDTMKNLEKRVV